MPRTGFTPTPAQLRAFVKVADLGSFTAAAAEAGQSQSALSQALSALEAGLGVELVRRGARRVELTAEGLHLVPYARSVLGGIDSMVSAADPGRAGRIPVTIGVIPTVAPYLLPPLLSGLGEDGGGFHPVVVEQQTAELVDQVRDGRLDAAFLAIPAGSRGVLEFPLYSERFVLATPAEHRLAGEPEITPADLDEQAVLLLESGHCLREQTLDLCRANNARILGAGQSRISGLSTAVRCVDAGLGITVLPATAAAVETRGTGCAVLEFAEPVPERTIGLVTRETVPATLVDTVYDVVRRHVTPALDVELVPRPEVSAGGE
ncbi:hydrogen peroxide-inducible genes activator [Dietzia sp.]|uniref:hydrogen peroxide-inducible genes activator n=1 Tax=Dietzia sp. TaxID=1871616 RepID=UPI002FD8B35A